MQEAVVLTPACYDVEVETLALFEGGDEDNVMKVEALYEDPRVVGNDDVIKEGEHQLARPVLYISKGKKTAKIKSQSESVLEFSRCFSKIPSLLQNIINIYYIFYQVLSGLNYYVLDCYERDREIFWAKRIRRREMR